jgi:hypothetical protein
MQNSQNKRVVLRVTRGHIGYKSCSEIKQSETPIFEITFYT